MSSKYQEAQRAKAINLIKVGSPVFYGGRAGKLFRKKQRDFILLDSGKNIYEPIRDPAKENVIDYFKKNQISWWGGLGPTGHVLSSQIACLNHLFLLRDDKAAVLKIVNNISKDFVDVLTITTDKYAPAFIQFEAVSDLDHLNEGVPTRGNNCTSIDALIYAVHKNGSKWLIPIEWKYTEYYANQNKAEEGHKKDPINCKGTVRLKRYTHLINQSKQLKSINHYCYYFEPFYQLMRQTLWAEQMIINKNLEKLSADNYLHVHVVPTANSALLSKEYKCSKKNMEDTWRELLVDPSKYLIISPENLMKGIDVLKYNGLLSYLDIRYY